MTSVVVNIEDDGKIFLEVRDGGWSDRNFLGYSVVADAHAKQQLREQLTLAFQHGANNRGSEILRLLGGVKSR